MEAETGRSYRVRVKITVVVRKKREKLLHRLSTHLLKPTFLGTLGVINGEM